MKKEQELLARIETLHEPRHLFVLPDWADRAALDQLIREGYVTCAHEQRDEMGNLTVAMNLELTPKAARLLHPQVELKGLALKGSLAGASFLAMSLLILYLG